MMSRTDLLVRRPIKKIDNRRSHKHMSQKIAGRLIVEVEVYFGWSILHEAKPGSFVDSERN
jgi:hypothetical protein